MTPEPDPTTPTPRRWIGRRGATAATALGLATGAFAGGFLISHAATTAATPSPSSSSSGSSSSGSSSAAPSPGHFVPNENPTHEAGESAAREAQENAGQVPTVP